MRRFFIARYSAQPHLGLYARANICYNINMNDMVDQKKPDIAGISA